MKKNDRGANCETQRDAYRYFSSSILYFIFFSFVRSKNLYRVSVSVLTVLQMVSFLS